MHQILQNKHQENYWDDTGTWVKPSFDRTNQIIMSDSEHIGLLWEIILFTKACK